jgi:hypothetical protein
MKKQALRVFTILAAVGALTIGSAYGQLPSGLKCDVPFDFTVGKVTLPAGAYTIKSMNSPAELLIKSADGRAAAWVFTIPIQAAAIQEQSQLVFNRYGDRYFLAKVWKTGEMVGDELIKSRAERQLADSGSKMETAIVVAQNR